MTQDRAISPASVELAAIEPLILSVAGPALSKADACGQPNVLRLVPRRGSGLGRATDIVVAIVAGLLIAPILRRVGATHRRLCGRGMVFVKYMDAIWMWGAQVRSLELAV